MEQREKLLRRALMGNAVFSVSTGLWMLWKPEMVASWLGIEVLWPLQVIGAGLLVFALDLLHQSQQRKLSIWRAYLASVQDFLWVGGTIVLLAGWGHWFSWTGKFLLIGVALVVELCGSLQLLGLRELYRNQTPGILARSEVKLTFETLATAQEAWDVIGALERIHEFSDDLVSSNLLEGEEVVRECRNRKGERWCETVTRRVEGASVTLEIQTGAEDYPHPFDFMVGTWSVEPTEKGSLITLHFAFTLRGGVLGELLVPAVVTQMGAGFQPMFARMKTAMEQETWVSPHRNSPVFSAG